MVCSFVSKSGWLTSVESIKGLLLKHAAKGKAEDVTVFHDMISGSVAGMLAGAITTPLDVVKVFDY